MSDGPFRFVAWRRGDRISLTANPSFFAGKPGLDSDRDSTSFPNEDTAVNLLRTHAIDYFFPALAADVSGAAICCRTRGSSG